MALGRNKGWGGDKNDIAVLFCPVPEVGLFLIVVQANGTRIIFATSYALQLSQGGGKIAMQCS